MKVSEALIYAVADTLQVDLHLIGDGYKAHHQQTEKVGPWEIRHDMQVKSDYLGPDAVSFFVKVRKNLWLYVVAYGGGSKLKCFVFDASIAKIASGFMASPCVQGQLQVTIKKLIASNAVIYEYTKDEVWALCGEANDLLK